MHRAPLFTLVLTIAFFTAMKSTCFPSDAEPSEHEQLLMEKINSARKNPIQTIQNFGMDLDRILSQIPEIENDLINGMPPLQFNPKLYRAAQQHTIDMIENRYYDTVSPDHKTPEERILESGYMPLSWGETLGFVAFQNFLDPEEAVEIMFENMFRDEFDSSAEDELIILNSDLKEIGVYIGGGSLEIGEKATNLYLATCDLAADGQEEAGAALLNLINEARSNPNSATVQDLIQNLEIENGNTPAVFENLEPFKKHAGLQQLAKDHLDHMIRNMFFDHAAEDGNQPRTAARSKGYDAAFLSQTIGAVVTSGFLEVENAVHLFFENLLIPGPVNGLSLSSNILFDPELEDIGLSVGVVSLPQPDGQILSAYLLVMDVATQTSVFSGGGEQNLRSFVAWGE